MKIPLPPTDAVAHELWAMAQGKASVGEVTAIMDARLRELQAETADACMADVSAENARLRAEVAGMKRYRLEEAEKADACTAELREELEKVRAANYAGTKVLVDRVRTLEGAARMTLMLRQCGGMLPSVRQLVDMAVDAADAALKEQQP